MTMRAFLLLAILQCAIGCDGAGQDDPNDKYYTTNVPTARQLDAFIKAARDGNARGVQQFIEGGYDVNTRTRSPKVTALLLASQNGHAEIVELLLSHGADPNVILTHGYTPLSQAARQGHADVVRLLLDNGARVDDRIDDGATPLFLATQFGHIEIVRLLLDRKASIDLPDNDGFTPLLTAVQKGHVELVRLLLSHNADSTHTNNAGMYSLELATNKGHSEIIEILFEHGVDVNQTFPQDWAQLEKTEYRSYPIRDGESVVLVPLEPGGDAARIRTGKVSYQGSMGLGNTKPTPSPDFTKVAVLDSSAKLSLWTSDGVHQVLVAPQLPVKYISGWSPDSRKLVIYSPPLNERKSLIYGFPDYRDRGARKPGGLYLVDLDSATAQRIDSLSEFVQWHDSSTLIGKAPGDSDNLISLRPGSRPESIGGLDSRFHDFTFSNDGRRWAIQYSAVGNATRLVLTDYPKLEGTLVDTGPFASFQRSIISPDGSKVIYRKRSSADPNAPQEVMLFEGSMKRRIARGVPIIWINDNSFLYKDGLVLLRFDLKTDRTVRLYPSATARISVEEIIPFVLANNVQLRERFIAQIVDAGPAAVPSLVKLLDDPRRGYANAAVLLLGRLGRDADAAIQPLRNRLLSADEELKIAIQQAIARIEKIMLDASERQIICKYAERMELGRKRQYLTTITGREYRKVREGDQEEPARGVPGEYLSTDDDDPGNFMGRSIVLKKDGSATYEVYRLAFKARPVADGAAIAYGFEKVASTGKLPGKWRQISGEQIQIDVSVENAAEPPDRESDPSTNP